LKGYLKNQFKMNEEDIDQGVVDDLDDLVLADEVQSDADEQIAEAQQPAGPVQLAPAGQPAANEPVVAGEQVEPAANPQQAAINAGEYIIVVWEAAYRFNENLYSSAIIHGMRYHPLGQGITSENLARSIRRGLGMIFCDRLGFRALNSGSVYGALSANLTVAAVRAAVQTIQNPPAGAAAPAIHLLRAAYWLKWLFDFEDENHPLPFAADNRANCTPIAFIVGDRMPLTINAPQP
jgi:hypothetical protein